MTEALRDTYAEVLRLTGEGVGAAEIARLLEIGKAAVYRARNHEKTRQPRAYVGLPYTCEGCDRTWHGAAGGKVMPLACPHCGADSYPPVSDAEVIRRLGALVKRLEAENKEEGPCLT